MNTDTPIEACWLQEPKVLGVMAAVGYLEGGLDGSLLVRLHVLQLGVNGINVLTDVLIDDLEDLLE